MVGVCAPGWPLARPGGGSRALVAVRARRWRFARRNGGTRPLVVVGAPWWRFTRLGGEHIKRPRPSDKHGVAVEIQLPDRPVFVVAHVHSPFNHRARHELDQWLDHIPSMGLVMGDFNNGKDSMWPRH